MKYLLDTDMCIPALKRNEGVIDSLLANRRTDIAASAVTEAELRTGAARSQSPRKTLAAVEHFLSPIQILAFDSGDAAAYARIRTRLEAAGTPIGPLDTLIVAQAVHRNLILVTNNVREFARVVGIRLENWLRE